jgi:NO-binding membrane sensor protein with MHYT domain
MLTAVVVVVIGLYIVGIENRPSLLLTGGAVTGAGVAVMHYVGMAVPFATRLRTRMLRS